MNADELSQVRAKLVDARVTALAAEFAAAQLSDRNPVEYAAGRAVTWLDEAIENVDRLSAERKKA